MIQFIKSQATSFAASLLDFCTTIFFVEIVRMNEEASIVVGNIAGGVVHYTLSRTWVFRAQEELVRKQFLRYWMVWILNFAMNFVLVVFLIRVGNWHYLLAKIAVSICLSMTFNYILNRKFVFRQ